MRAWIGGLLAAITLVYPFAVWWGLGHVPPAWMAAALAVLMAARAWTTRRRFWLAAAVVAALLAAASSGANSVPLKLYPVLVNAGLLALFGASLWRGPPVVERLARLREPDLPTAAVAYTRKVTIVWCMFFTVNGTLALATALWATDAVWALYNGLIAYGLMGLLFGVEWLVRQQVQARVAPPRPGHG